MKQQKLSADKKEWSKATKSFLEKNPDAVVVLVVGVFIGIFLKYILIALMIGGIGYVMYEYKKKSNGGLKK